MRLVVYDPSMGWMMLANFSALVVLQCSLAVRQLLHWMSLQPCKRDYPDPGIAKIRETKQETDIARKAVLS